MDFSKELTSSTGAAVPESEDPQEATSNAAKPYEIRVLVAL
jgi:hypothetical protein